ncbi:MAG TPA: peptide ABC transporter substrate-binding protein [Candidatus Alectryocaccomicrobium excrementavium]|uniref:Peptide ABC transporter substrate-binding protein n=1 Tax=Candidatus Alectryocaccomicrobium excrementavium TaxID=2840668 RepID=A0A9D1K6I7_9FIRM|nr:peptide ABC transporter substrate-binding protein [Candidatus Alectryocaccomicrobium excrementavium]
MKIIKFSMQRNNPGPRRRASLALACLLAALALLLSGCQASPEGYALPTAVPGAVATFAPETTAAPDPMRTGDITMGVVADANAMVNPIYCTTRDIINLNTLVFESVVELNDAMQPVPLLADRWTVDGTTWTFTLRSGIIFHDGSPLTAYDVVASFNSIRAAGAAYPWYSRVSAIESMLATSDTELVVTANTSGYIFLYSMTFPVLQRNTLNDALPMGTGPYWYIQYTTDTALRMEANPLWWKQPSRVQSVLALFYSETVDALLALQTGEINTLATRSTTAALSRNLKGRTSMDYSTTTYEHIAVNLSDPILSDVEVRRALMYAIDRSTLAENSYLGMVQQTEVPISPGSWLYETQSAAFNYSPERALAILRAQGWSDSNGDFYLDKMINGTLTTLELEIITYDEPSAPTRSNAAAAIVEQLETIGIRATYNPLDPDGNEWTMETMQRALRGGRFQLALIGVNLSQTPDLRPLLATRTDDNSDTSLNFSGYASPAMDSYLNEVMTAADEVAFAAAIANVQMQLIEDLPILGLFFRSGTLISTLDISSMTGIREGNVLRGIEFL